LSLFYFKVLKPFHDGRTSTWII
jgi:Na+/proline symporter